MRAVLVAILVALSLPAMAQSTTPTSPAPTGSASAARNRGGDVTKEEYVERAKRAAERRFDRLDLNHDGVLTADERRAVRDQRQQRRAARSQ